MLRRSQRQRREFMYRKALDGKERAAYENKLKIKTALQEGKPIPTELRNEEAALRNEIDLEDENTAVLSSQIDNEYANAAFTPPRIMITTSRNPSAPLGQFAKELCLVFPNAEKMNRGNQVVPEIINSCRSHDFTDVIFVRECRGVPDGLIVCHLPNGPTIQFNLKNVVMRHDIKDRKMKTISQAYPHIILNNMTTRVGQRIATILKHLFPVPKPDSKRIVTFANQSDYISFRHHAYEQKGGPKSLDLEEIGPRFEMSPFKLTLGTLDQTEAEVEWALRPYMNTSKKRKYLAEKETM